MTHLILIPIYFLNFIINFFKKILWINHQDAKISKICIYRVGNLGDIACSIPAINNVKKIFPRASIHFLTSSGNQNSFNSKMLLKNFQMIDEYIIYRKFNFKLLRLLRSKKFDLYIELPSDLASFTNQLRNIFFAYFINSKKAFGWEVRTIKLQKRALNKYVNYDNEVIRLNKIINRNLNKENEVNYNFTISNEIKEEILKKFNVNEYQYICVSAGGKRRSNIWPAENYIKLIKKIIDEYNYRVLLIGGLEDLIYSDLIINPLENEYKDNIINFIGKTSLIESIYLLSGSKCLISNDTGTQHLASITGTKTISIFSSRDMKKKWYPFGNLNQVFRPKLECLCYDDDCPKCSQNLKDIDPTYVFSSIKI